MGHILEVDSIQISFDNRTILSDIYLQCKTNDILGIFGRNGSGKTTLLQIIYGTLATESKFVRIDREVLPTAYLKESAIAFLPQISFIPHQFSVEKAVYLFLEKENAECLMQDEFIQKIAKNQIGNLSGGESKYLHLLLILHKETKFCMLDEPYAGLSPLMIEKINAVIRQQASYKGIIITDHSYRYVLDVVNKLYLLKDGKGWQLNHKEELTKFGYLTENML